VKIVDGFTPPLDYDRITNSVNSVMEGT